MSVDKVSLKCAKESASSLSSCSSSSCSEPPDLEDFDENRNNVLEVKKMTLLNYQTGIVAMGQENIMYGDYHCGMQKVPQLPPMQTQAVHQQQQPLQKKIVESSRSGKRSRTVFTSTQLMELERAFKDCNYLCRSTRFHLSQTLHLTERQIKIWFQNRRMKQKKDLQKKTGDNSGEGKMKKEVCCSPAKAMSVASPVNSIDGNDVQVPTSSSCQQQPLQQQILLSKHEAMDHMESYDVTTSVSTTTATNSNFYAADCAYQEKILSNNNQKSVINYHSSQQNVTPPMDYLYATQLNTQHYQLQLQQQQEQQQLYQSTQHQQYIQQQQSQQKLTPYSHFNLQHNYKLSSPAGTYNNQTYTQEQQQTIQQQQPQQDQKYTFSNNVNSSYESILNHWCLDNVQDVLINQSNSDEKQNNIQDFIGEATGMSITSL